MNQISRFRFFFFSFIFIFFSLGGEVWFVGSGWAYGRQSNNKFLGRLCRSGIAEEHWKFVCLWRCEFVLYCVYKCIMYYTMHISLKVWSLSTEIFFLCNLLSLAAGTFSWGVLISLNVNIAVNENDVRKTLIDAIPRILSWILLFKNKVRQNSEWFLWKDYFLLSFGMEVIPLLLPNVTDTSKAIWYIF